ncbi:MAG TPA: radical SAM protein [Bacteroidales bacterium]|nr:radical SAM protein [Bacteroidales bacterium]HPS15968.1 radical SAM protein [Bacteroidales bacterium]
MKEFKNIYIDITNTCNAKCPFCITGKHKPAIKKYIEPEVFDNILISLIRNKSIVESSVIYLYNWGEPFLHPKLSELISILNKHNLQFGLSTNGSIEFNFPDNFCKNLVFFKFSLSGFSQNSYNKIHGFNFEKTLLNIERIIKNIQNENPQTYIELNFHIYQFNISEIEACRDFAKKIKVHFYPCLAILNDWDNLNLYMGGELPYNDLLEVSQKLLMYNFNDLLKASPSDYKCPQYDLLVIDESANISGCCQLPKDNKEYSCGNILTDDWNTILKNKTSMMVCRNCIKSGLAYYIHNSMLSIDFSKDDFLEKTTTIDLMKIIANRFKRKLF